MIKSLQIKNVQSHKDSFLEFHKGVNMIVGPSDNGKSAIFNALYKVMYNRPLGDEWRSWGGGSSSIKLELDNGIITYTKNKKGVYSLNDIEFNAFGSEVPNEISTLLNIDRKVNIQQQLEKEAPIFLISESPGDVAKFFNKVAGLYKIDETITKGKQDLTKTERELSTVRNLITEKEEELEEYKGIEKLDKKVKAAQRIQDTLNNTYVKKQKIQTLLNKITPLKKSIKIKEYKLKTKDKLNKALNIQQNIKIINSKILKIQQSLEKIHTKKELIKINTKRIKVLPKINAALKMHNTLNLINAKIIKIKRIESAIKSSYDKIEYLSTYKQKIVLKYTKIMPDVCPLCNTILKGD